MRYKFKEDLSFNHILTKEHIQKSKEGMKNIYNETYYEHDDCVRIAYEFLSAQPVLSQAPPRHKRGLFYSLKSMIEHWAGRYVSTDDVKLAAKILGLKGTYPFYNIPIAKTRPLKSRLTNIKEAFTQRESYNDCYDEYFKCDEV